MSRRRTMRGAPEAGRLAGLRFRSRLAAGAGLASILSLALSACHAPGDAGEGREGAPRRPRRPMPVEAAGPSTNGDSESSGASRKPSETISGATDGATPETEATPAIELSPITEEIGSDEAHERIDLLTALRLAGARSVDVEIMRERLQQAEADLAAATSRYLPDIEVGAGYVRHDGRFQETRGEVFDVSRSSLGAGPSVHLRADPAAAHFERLRSKQLVTATRHGGEATRAEAMVHSAALYLELLEARAMVDVAEEAVEHARAHVELTRASVEAEAELRVRLVRAQAELARDEQRLLAVRNEVDRASVALAVWLRLPPEVRLVPDEDRIAPLTLVDPDRNLGALLEAALAERPDIRAQEARVRAAENQLDGARWEPWIPEVDLFAHYGLFGGGRGGFFGDFGDRSDAGATLNWTLEGFGLGDRARYLRAAAEAGEERIRLSAARESAEGNVISALNEARSLRARVDAAAARVDASRETLELVRERFQANDAIQLEVLAAIEELAASRAELVRAIIAYNKAQHALHYAVRGEAWGGF